MFKSLDRAKGLYLAQYVFVSDDIFAKIGNVRLKEISFLPDLLDALRNGSGRSTWCIGRFQGAVFVLTLRLKCSQQSKYLHIGRLLVACSSICL